MSRRALLDVNVLVALFDPDHVHHESAHRWLAEQRPFGWATCPSTENGLVRVLGNPAYSPAAERPALVLGRLREFCSSSGHAFWPDDVSLRDPNLFRAGVPSTHRQVTDLYLLGLAVRRHGRLATFDRGISLANVHGAEADNLVLIPA